MTIINNRREIETMKRKATHLAPDGYNFDGCSRPWTPVVVVKALGGNMIRCENVKTGERFIMPSYGLKPVTREQS